MGERCRAVPDRVPDRAIDRAIDTVLFDLDGTLVDSERSIIATLRVTFAELGLPPLTDDVARTLIGPPFARTIPPLIGADRTPEMIARYRERYATSCLDVEVYPGVDALLAQLRATGVTVAVATSKPEPAARRIIEHLGLTDAFAAIAGDDPGEFRGDKALVVADALRRLGGLAPDRVLMVGDTRHDMVGALANGVAAVGAGWGYGPVAELIAAGAIEVFATADELRAALPRLGVGGAR
ncbi:MAG: HAD hydrolase-like protein [Actinomycetia bacterium]|nr:HAD hydrolase-like protein [Actinomycetes bacterium]